MSETTALVTGASGGIGAAICQLLAARGATIILHYHADRASAEAVRRELPGTGHALLQADLGDAVQLLRIWQELAAHRRVDVLVNNAGIFPDHPPLTTGYADWTAAWQQTLATNLLGAANLSVFAGYGIYFPELYPTRLRSTGTSFCYNIGRLVAAVGPLGLGLLTSRVYHGPDAMRYAGITMSAVFLIGLAALPFAPETKGRPLPE